MITNRITPKNRNRHTPMRRDRHGTDQNQWPYDAGSDFSKDDFGYDDADRATDEGNG